MNFDGLDGNLRPGDYHALQDDDHEDQIHDDLERNIMKIDMEKILSFENKQNFQGLPGWFQLSDGGGGIWPLSWKWPSRSGGNVASDERRPAAWKSAGDTRLEPWFELVLLERLRFRVSVFQIGSSSITGGGGGEWVIGLGTRFAYLKNLILFWFKFPTTIIFLENRSYLNKVQLFLTTLRIRKKSERSTFLLFPELN